MGVSIDGNNPGWDASLAGRGLLYDLVYAAMNRSAAAERVNAVVALGKSEDPRAVRPLADLLGDADPEVRLSATTALGHLKSGRPVDDLIVRLRDRGEQLNIREQAAMALSAIRSTGAIRELWDFAADRDEEPSLRLYVENLLRDISLW
jgi:HEAT repeat protein